MENMSSFSDVPPGFRFHPTDEELVDYYLRKKIASRRIDLDVIKDVDLYKIEPWDLQGKDDFYILNREHIHRFYKNNLVKELCKLGTEEQNEWYFFSHKDKKYPTGTRTNRATKAGFWKATGRDKAIYSKNNLVGMRKTLVFYQGRAPNGQKSDWIMHEYRLETNENGAPQEEGWVVCRAFKKKMTAIRRFGEHESPCWYDEQVTFMPDFDSPRQITNQPQYSPYNNFYICKQELELVQYTTPHDTYVQLPHLESPKMIPSPYGNNGSTLRPSTFVHEEDYVQQSVDSNYAKYGQGCDQEVTDWRVLDKFVASQLSQEEEPKEEKYLNACSFHENEDDIATEYATISTGTNFPIDMWK